MVLKPACCAPARLTRGLCRDSAREGSDDEESFHRKQRRRLGRDRDALQPTLLGERPSQPLSFQRLPIHGPGAGLSAELSKPLTSLSSRSEADFPSSLLPRPSARNQQSHVALCQAAKMQAQHPGKAGRQCSPASVASSL